MISKKMATSINKQINREMYSAYLYLSMSAYATSTGFEGTATWLSVQAKEEMEHAMKMYHYLHEQGAAVELEAIAAPPKKFASVVDIFEKTLEHEKVVTSHINALYKQATAEGDAATAIFYQWFVTEQVEEEANATEILQKLELAGSSNAGLYIIDKELGSRKAE